MGICEVRSTHWQAHRHHCSVQANSAGDQIFYDNAIITRYGSDFREVEKIPSSLYSYPVRLHIETFLCILPYTPSLGHEIGLNIAATLRQARVVKQRLGGVLDWTIIIYQNFFRWGNSERMVCNRDVPMTMDDCSRVEVLFKVDGTQSLESAIEAAYQAKRSSIEAHADHKLCPIRAEKNNLLKGLELVVDNIRDSIPSVS